MRNEASNTEQTRPFGDFLRGLIGKHSRRDPLGPEGEDIAAKFLRSHGYRILGRNLRVKRARAAGSGVVSVAGGEADLLALAPDRRTIVLVEVKTRTVNAADAAPGQVTAPPPEASVGVVKQEKLRRILRSLIAANGWRSRPCRIDVVAIELPRASTRQQGARRIPIIRHHVGAVALDAS